MTSPLYETPANAYTSSTVSSMQNVTQADIGQQQGAEVSAMLDNVGFSFIDVILGGFSNVIGAIGAAINKFIGDLLIGLKGVTGGLIDLTGFIKNTDNKTNQIIESEIPRLDNRINDVSSGGVSAVRASFFTNGTWTKPAGYSRHVVMVIGGASGGGRANQQTTNNGLGGYAGGRNEYEFFDTDLPATVVCEIGAGGAGATADGGAGSPGGQTNFGVYGSAGGALTTGHGFGEKTRQLRGGNGGAVFSGVTIAATAGTGHGFANGGAAGTPNGSGNPGGNGNRPTPNTLPEYGTGGGGGAHKGGTGSGGRGGDGAVPGGPGGGGGQFSSFGFAGNGGNGAPGAVFITSYK